MKFGYDLAVYFGGCPFFPCPFFPAALTDSQIWDIAIKNIVSASGKSVYARADILTKSITKDDLLIVEPDNSPPRHANIIGWPEEKFERQHLANKLAQRVRKVIINT